MFTSGHRFQFRRRRTSVRTTTNEQTTNGWSIPSVRITSSANQITPSGPLRPPIKSLGAPISPPSHCLWSCAPVLWWTCPLCISVNFQTRAPANTAINVQSRRRAPANSDTYSYISNGRRWNIRQGFVRNCQCNKILYTCALNSVWELYTSALWHHRHHSAFSLRQIHVHVHVRQQIAQYNELSFVLHKPWF